MTVLQLLAYICAALMVQLALGVGVLVWRRRAQRSTPVHVVAPAASEVRALAWSGWRDFRVVRRCFEDAALSQCSFYLQPLDGVPLPPFRPGQYLTFMLPSGDAAGGVVGSERSLTRCYSLSDAPNSETYRITIKRMLPPPDRLDLPPGAASSYFHERVREGDVLQVRAPSGQFFIDPDASVSTVFIAGGIGITPMMSMLRWCVANQPERLVELYYGVRNSAEQAFKQDLEALGHAHPGFKLHRVYSRPGPDDVQGRDHEHLGYIDLALLRSSLAHGRHQFYVCGPPLMMQSLVPALREWGVEEGDIHFEAFGPASVRVAGPATNEPLAVSSMSLQVSLTRSGRTLVWDGQDANLLDFAQRQGVAADSGCRSGSCGACETRLVSGAVSYADKPDHEITPGHCLLCVGRPQSALVLEL